MLVNNAGVDRPGSILEADAEGIDLLVDVNLRAVLHLCRLVVPGMVARDRGHVINISSIAGGLQFRRQQHLSRDQGGGEHAVAPAAHRRSSASACGSPRSAPGGSPPTSSLTCMATPKRSASGSSRASSCRRPTDIADAIAFAIAAPDRGEHRPHGDHADAAGAGRALRRRGPKRRRPEQPRRAKDRR